MKISTNYVRITETAAIRNARRHATLFAGILLLICSSCVPLSLFAQAGGASSTSSTTTDNSAGRTITLVNLLPEGIRSYYTAKNLAAILPSDVGRGEHITVRVELSRGNNILITAELGSYSATAGGLRLVSLKSETPELSVGSVPSVVNALAMWAQGTAPHSDVPSDVASALSNHYVTVTCRFTNGRGQWLDLVALQDRTWPPEFHFRPSLVVGERGRAAIRVESQSEKRANSRILWRHTEYYRLDPIAAGGGRDKTQVIVHFFQNGKTQ